MGPMIGIAQLSLAKASQGGLEPQPPCGEVFPRETRGQGWDAPMKSLIKRTHGTPPPVKKEDHPPNQKKKKNQTNVRTHTPDERRTPNLTNTQTLSKKRQKDTQNKKHIRKGDN